MTPKEKAERIVDSFYEDDLLWEDISYIQAKRCATIAINLAIIYTNSIPKYATDEKYEHTKQFLQEVKQEIEKL